MNTLTNLKSSGMLPCNFSIPYSNGLKKLNVGVWKLYKELISHVLCNAFSSQFLSKQFSKSKEYFKIWAINNEAGSNIVYNLSDIWFVQ